MTAPSEFNWWSDFDGFDVFDRKFARTLGAVAGEEQPEVLLAAALTSRVSRLGHVCLDLQRLDDQLLEDLGVEMQSLAALLGPFSRLTELLHHSPLVSTAERRAPLVLDSEGRLYLRRMWDAQEHLASMIIPRAAVCCDGLDSEFIDRALARYFSDETPGGQLQAAAAREAIERGLTVITGGPGTGKTSVVVKILAVLIEHGRRMDSEPLKVALLAPTGKAALRLTESIRRAKGAPSTVFDCDEATRALIPEEAKTIHRALGISDSGSVRGTGAGRRRLDADVVVVDESSMVDLTLMSRVFEAVPEGARVIVLGDREQLASVEAGAVLGDICDGLPGRVVELQHSYRFDAVSGISKIASAIRLGDADTALAVLSDPNAGDVKLVEPERDRAWLPQLEEHLARYVEPLLEESRPAERLRRLGESCILSARRTGRRGVSGINRMVESLLTERGMVSGTNWYDGRPVMLGQNDYELGLFNGELGIVARSSGGGLRVFFERADTGQALGERGTLDYSPAMLPPCETAFAMTIHKAQGSEFDHVLVVLPDEPSALLSRELLYTAVTRARRSVTILGAPDIIASAIATPTERHSGLSNRLRKISPE